MTNIVYLSIIDKLLDDYKYEVTEDGYTFMIEKRNGNLYHFLCKDYFNKFDQYATKLQINSMGLAYIAKEIEDYFFSHK